MGQNLDLYSDVIGLIRGHFENDNEMCERYALLIADDFQMTGNGVFSEYIKLILNKHKEKNENEKDTCIISCNNDSSLSRM